MGRRAVLPRPRSSRSDDGARGRRRRDHGRRPRTPTREAAAAIAARVRGARDHAPPGSSSASQTDVAAAVAALRPYARNLMIDRGRGRRRRGADGAAGVSRAHRRRAAGDEARGAEDRRRRRLGRRAPRACSIGPASTSSRSATPSRQPVGPSSGGRRHRRRAALFCRASRGRRARARQLRPSVARASKPRAGSSRPAPTSSRSRAPSSCARSPPPASRCSRQIAGGGRRSRRRKGSSRRARRCSTSATRGRSRAPRSRRRSRSPCSAGSAAGPWLDGRMRAALSSCSTTPSAAVRRGRPRRPRR